MEYFSASTPFRVHRTQPYGSLTVLVKASELSSSAALRKNSESHEEMGITC